MWALLREHGDLAGGVAVAGDLSPFLLDDRALSRLQVSERASDGVNDQNVAFGAVRDRVRHRAEHAPRAGDPLVAHYDEVASVLIGQPGDRLARIAACDPLREIRLSQTLRRVLEHDPAHELVPDVGERDGRAERPAERSAEVSGMRGRGRTIGCDQDGAVANRRALSGVRFTRVVPGAHDQDAARCRM